MTTLKINYFILIMLTSFQLSSQNDTKYSIFWSNLSIFNPAETGGIRSINGNQHLALNGQTPTVGIDSVNSNSFSFLYEIKLDSSNNSFGVNYQQDQIGTKINSQANLNYSRLFRIKSGNLSLGAAVGCESINKLNINGGLVYWTRKLKTGIGVTHINQSDSNPEKYSFTKTRNYYFNFQYSFHPGPSLNLIPMILIRSTIKNTVADLNLLADLRFKFGIYLGAGYRTSNSILFIAGIQIKQRLRITYAYNYSKLDKFKSLNNSNEISLNLLFNKRQ